MAQILKEGMGIAVIGAGAVGGALAVTLRQGLGVPAFLWGRQGPWRGAMALAGGARDLAAEFPAPPPAPWRPDAVFVAVKAYDLAAAVRAHRSLFTPGRLAIVLANGHVGPVVDALAREIPALWRLGVVTMGVREDGGPGRWRRTEGGAIAWGARRADVAAAEGSAAPTPLEAALVAAGAPWGLGWLDDAPAAAARKWLINASLNTFLAARGLARNGDALAPDRKRELLAFHQEAMALGETLFGPWPLPPEALRQELLTLVAATAANENSMVRDRRLGKRTESEALAGFALGDPRRYPLLAEAHRALVASARARDSGDE